MRSRKRSAVDEVKTWNDAHKPGLAVVLTLDDGSKKETTTRSEAWEVCGHAVILVEGVSGGYLLSRVKPNES